MTDYRIDVESLDEKQKTRYKNGIWWIASYPKSGSTWIRMFVNAAITKFPVDINAAFQYASSDMMAIHYQAVSCIPVGLMGAREAIYLRPAMLLNYLATHPGRDGCMKTHHANLYIDEIPLCPPKLTRGAIYVVRDPRDVCVSFAKHLGKTVDEAIDFMKLQSASLQPEGAFFYHFLTTWSDHVKSWLDTRNPIQTGCIKYEDMLSSPETTFREVLGCLGLDERIGDDAFRFALEQTRFENLQRQEQEKGFRETGGKQDTFFNQGQAGHWMNILTGPQVERIEEDHGEMMDVLGYKRYETKKPRLSEMVVNT